MKLKSLFLFFALMMGSAMIANAQKERLVFWVHGLGGDGSSWQKAAQATTLGNVSGFGPTKIFSSQLSYSEFNSAISTASDKLDEEIIITGNALSAAKGITDKTKNFIIAHSQGGIVSRFMDKRYQDFPTALGNRNFGGIVTFGTSHQGAIALNNTPMLQQIIAEGCTDLLVGPTEEQIPNNFFLNFITSGFNVESVIEPACKFIANDIVPIVTSDFVSPINQDYRVGAAVINEINSVQTQTNKVAFYGVEADPLVWRMLYSLRGKQPNLFDPFQADDDSPLVAKANENQLKYQLKASQHQSEYNGLGWDYCSWWQWVTMPYVCPFHDAVISSKRRKEAKMRDAWTQGSNWWLNANNRYKAAMGATEAVGTFSTAYECDCASYDGNGNAGISWSGVSSTPQECYNQGSYDPGSGAYTNCSLGSPTTIVNWSLVNNESDGIVLASSASGYPGAKTKEMIGSNHQQMRNDSNTKDRLNELYNGTHGIYFRSR
jgi:pimeloyl-ACP methyl ester carboxylesterase